MRSKTFRAHRPRCGWVRAELSPCQHPHRQDPVGTTLGLPQLWGALGQGGEQGARAGKQRVDTDDRGDAHCGRRKRRAAQAGLV